MAELATDGDRPLVVLAVVPNAQSVIIWDSAKEDIVGEYSFSPKGFNGKPGCSPRPFRIYRSFSASVSNRPHKRLEASSREKGGPVHPEGICAWVNPSRSVPVLALMWLQNGIFKFSIVNYSSGALLHELPQQPWHHNPAYKPVVGASFSGDGRTLLFLHETMLFIYSFSVKRDGSVSMDTYVSVMDDIYDKLEPIYNADYRIQSNFVGSRFMLISRNTLSALVLPTRKEVRDAQAYDRSLYKLQLMGDGATGPLPTGAEQSGSCLVAGHYETEISLIFTESLTTVLFSKDAAHTPCGLADGTSVPILYENLVTNGERSRAVWERGQSPREEKRPDIAAAFTVADLTPPLAQWDETTDDRSIPSFKSVLHRPVDSSCDLLLLNKSADRLVCRKGYECELWELPSGRHIATRNLCAASEPCFRHVGDSYYRSVFLPIAFLTPSRTLIFVSADLWVYNAQTAPHITMAPNGEAQKPPPPRCPPRTPSWRPGSGVSSPLCAACRQSHAVRARRHLCAGFSQKTFWKCFWADAGSLTFRSGTPSRRRGSS